MRACALCSPGGGASTSRKTSALILNGDGDELAIPRVARRACGEKMTKRGKWAGRRRLTLFRWYHADQRKSGWRAWRAASAPCVRRATSSASSNASRNMWRRDVMRGRQRQACGLKTAIHRAGIAAKTAALLTSTWRCSSQPPCLCLLLTLRAGEGRASIKRFERALLLHDSTQYASCCSRILLENKRAGREELLRWRNGRTSQHCCWLTDMIY